MIGKIRWGSRVTGLVHYLYGPGLANEHVDPRIVAGWRSPKELEPAFRPEGSRDFRNLIGLLNQPLAAAASRGYSRPVLHCSVRAAPQDRFLTDAEWRRIANMVMDRTGLAPAGDLDGVRWVAIRHGPDHIHIVATLVRQDGRLPDTNDIYRRLRQACQAIEAEFGLRATAGMDRTSAVRPTRAETEKAARAGRTETPREQLRRTVITTAAQTGSETAFFAGLRAAGVLVHHRTDSHTGALAGYAVALPGDRSRSGAPVCFSGGRLAPDLTLPKLRHRWSAAGGRDPIPGDMLSAPSVRAVLRTVAESAARNARNETDYFLRLNEAGIRVRRRFSDHNPTRITGYALHIRGHNDERGQPVWLSAAKLDPGLSLTALRRTWSTASVSGLTWSERDAIWHDAARAAAEATGQLRDLPAGHPHAIDIAWATSDLLHAAAARLGRNNALRRAATSYDRAARPRHARLPQPSRYGDQLRGAARLLGLLSHGTHDRTLADIAAIARLAELTAVIAEFRDRQHHFAQREAASTSAAILHASCNGSPRRAAAVPVSGGPLRDGFPGRPPTSGPSLHTRPAVRPQPPPRQGPRRRT